MATLAFARADCSSGIGGRHGSYKTSTLIPHTRRLRFKHRGSVRISALDSERKTVITIGEALYDCLADQPGRPKGEVESWTPYPGGAPANVATATSKLGLHSVLLSAIGNDELGDRFMELLQECHVDVKFIQRVEQPTRDVLVTRTLDGDREFSGFGQSTETYADCFLDSAQLPEEAITAADALVTGTLGLAYPKTKEAIERAASLAKSSPSCTLVIDVNWRPVFWDDLDKAKDIISGFVQLADLIKITDEEAAWLFGIDASDALSDPGNVLSQLPGAACVLVSAGEKGSSYAFRAPGGKMDVTGAVPVLSVDIADTTGAGDAYLAGFIYFMLSSGGLEALQSRPELFQKAVEFATACGAFTCTKPGAIDSQPNLEEVSSLLH